MYAIIKTGSKQYRVEKGDRITIEKTNQQEGTITFSEESILFIYDGKTYKAGLPHVKKAKVEAKILGEVAGPKGFAFRYRKRKDSKRTRGYRQKYQEIAIENFIF